MAEYTKNKNKLSELLYKIASDSDKDSFKDLFHEIGPRIKGYLMKLGSNEIVAEDILQEVMLTVWRKASTFDRRKASASTWLFTIARNKRIDFLRKESRPEIDVSDPLLIVDCSDLADEVYNKQQDSTRIAKFIRALPDKQGLLIKKFYYEDKSHSEIAQELNLPLGTVKSRLRLATSKLKEVLEKEDVWSGNM